MTEKNIPLSNAFTNIANTPEFANLVGSVFGKLHEGISTIENEFEINNSKNKKSKKFYKSCEKYESDNDSNDSSDDVINDIYVDDLINKNEEILDCEISSTNEEFDNINIKITEFQNTLKNILIDKNGNNIADILSEISNTLKIISIQSKNN